MKPPKRNTGHHVNIAPEHPLYMKKGGDVKPNNAVYTTEEQYKADLLNPWSKEKAKAQSDWNKKKLNAERLNAANVYKSVNPDFVDPNAYDSEKEKTRKIVQSHYGAGGTEQKPLYSEEAEINKWTGQKAQQKKREEQTNMMMTGVAAAPLVYGAGALALQGASAAMAIPEVSGGINAYFGMQGIKNVPKTIEAWKDPNTSTFDAVGQTAMNALELYPATSALAKNEKVATYAKDFVAAKGFPKYENVFRAQAENFTKGEHFNPNLSAEQNTYTGGWYDANKKNTMDYIKGQQVKDPEAVKEVLVGRLPKKTLKSISGHNLPEEAKLMSYGKGDYKSWKEVADAGHITSFEAKVMQKVEQNPELAKKMTDGTYGDEAWSKAWTSAKDKIASNKSLIEKSEALLPPKVLERVQKNKPIEASLDPKVLEDAMKKHEEKYYPLPKSLSQYVPYKNGGGIKGYVIGGDIQKNDVRDPTIRNWGTSTQDYINDIGLAVVDWHLQGIGAQDVIKDEDYATKAGTDSNRLNSGVGAVSSAVGGAVLDYYIPGAGAAVNEAKSGLGGAIGEDEGISQADKDMMANIQNMGRTASTITSSISNGSVPSTSTVDELGIDTKTGEIAKPDQKGKNTNWSTFNTADFKGNTDATSAYNTAKTGQEKQAVIDAYYNGNYGMAKGGKVQGNKEMNMDEMMNSHNGAHMTKRISEIGHMKAMKEYNDFFNEQA
jgi:hypothetical protein